MDHKGQQVRELRSSRVNPDLPVHVVVHCNPGFGMQLLLQVLNLPFPCVEVTPLPTAPGQKRAAPRPGGLCTPSKQPKEGDAEDTQEGMCT